MADSNERIVQPVPLPAVVVDVAGGDYGESLVIGNACERAGETLVASYRVTLELDKEAILPEYCSATLGEPASGRQSFVAQYSGKKSIAASGKDEEAVVVRFYRREVEPRITPVLPVEVCLGDESAEVRISLRCFCEECHVGSVEKRELRAGNCLQAYMFCRLGKCHGAIEAMMIGERDCGIAFCPRLEHELLR
jgi:hypothetical protein